MNNNAALDVAGDVSAAIAQDEVRAFPVSVENAGTPKLFENSCGSLSANSTAADINSLFYLVLGLSRWPSVRRRHLVAYLGTVVGSCVSAQYRDPSETVS